MPVAVPAVTRTSGSTGDSPPDASVIRDERSVVTGSHSDGACRASAANHTTAVYACRPAPGASVMRAAPDMSSSPSMPPAAEIQATLDGNLWKIFLSKIEDIVRIRNRQRGVAAL